MKLEDFNFDLPENLIAQAPLSERTASRLLCLNGKTGSIMHRHFTDILDLLKPHDLLILNDTKVIPARLFAYKQTGGKVEILIERITDPNTACVQMRASKSLKIGAKLFIENNYQATIIAKNDGFFTLKFSDNNSNDADILSILQQFGHIPLPPYINREATNIDQDRYQTVFAKHDGAVAAPTAGLHFDQELLAKIATKGIDIAHITLHVGAGTFQPVRVANIEEHKMHSEHIEVSPQVCAQIARTRASGGRIIAVGTTCVRSLETAAQQIGDITPFSGETDIFIYPGYKFKVVDALITNFHLPKSTLLMLTCAFGGYANVMHAYQEAVAMQYRFFSYGDAMFISKC